MNVNEVIKHPILTEKTYAQMAEGVYTFSVDVRTNRAEVKKAVEFIFGVKVEKVNIISVPKKATKLGRSQGFTNRIKKAIVYLADGAINIFPDDVASAPVVEEVKEETKEMSAAEKRAAEKLAKANKED